MNYYKPRNPWETDPHKNPEDKWQKPVPPKPVTIADLFPRLDRLSIGWSPLLDTLREVTAAKPSYPPYDLIKVDDVSNLLTVAVAGFSKSEVTVTVQDSILIIKGEKMTAVPGEIIHKGIAERDFELKLAIAEYWEVTSASLEDGLLTITFNKFLPEEKKPKVIDIQ